MRFRDLYIIQNFFEVDFFLVHWISIFLSNLRPRSTQKKKLLVIIYLRSLTHMVNQLKKYNNFWARTWPKIFFRGWKLVVVFSEVKFKGGGGDCKKNKIRAEAAVATTHDGLFLPDTNDYPGRPRSVSLWRFYVKYITLCVILFVVIFFRVDSSQTKPHAWAIGLFTSGPK